MDFADLVMGDKKESPFVALMQEWEPQPAVPTMLRDAPEVERRIPDDTGRRITFGLKDLGVSEQDIKKRDELLEHQSALMDRARKEWGGEEDSGQWWTRNLGKIGIGMSYFANKQGKEAMERIEKGSTDYEDFYTLAKVEKYQEQEANQSKTWKGTFQALPFQAAGMAGDIAVAGGLLGAAKAGATAAAPRAAASVAGAVGEGIGANMLKGAALAPFAPSVYVHGMERNLEAGRGSLNPLGIGGAMGSSAITFGVLGGLSGKVGNIFSGKGAAEFTKGLAAAGATMPVAMAASQMITGAVGLDAGFGTVGDIYDGKYGDALRGVVRDAVLGGAFHIVHSLPGNPTQRVAEVLKQAHRSGIKPEKAAEMAQAELAKIMGEALGRYEEPDTVGAGNPMVGMEGVSRPAAAVGPRGPTPNAPGPGRPAPPQIPGPRGPTPFAPGPGRPRDPAMPEPTPGTPLRPEEAHGIFGDILSGEVEPAGFPGIGNKPAPDPRNPLADFPGDRPAAQQVTEPPKVGEGLVKSSVLERMKAKGKQAQGQPKAEVVPQTDLTQARRWKVAEEGAEDAPHELTPALEALRLEIESGQAEKADLDKLKPLHRAVLDLRRVEPGQLQPSFEAVAAKLAEQGFVGKGGQYTRQRMQQIEKEALKELGEVKSTAAKQKEQAAEAELDRAFNDLTTGERGVSPGDLSHRPEDVHARAGDRIDTLKSRDHAGAIVLEKYQKEKDNARRQGLSLSEEREAFWADRFVDADEGRLSPEKAKDIGVAVDAGQAGGEVPAPEAQGRGRVGANLVRKPKVPEAQVKAEAKNRYELDKQDVDAWNTMISSAYRMARNIGIDLDGIMRRKATKEGDAASVRALDKIADQVVPLYDQSAQNHTEFLYDALREGRRAPKKFAEYRDEVAEEAMKAAEQRKAERTEFPFGFNVEQSDKPTPPSSAMGIVAPGTQEALKVIGAFRKAVNWLLSSREAAPEPPLTLDRDHLLPNPQNWGNWKLIASTPRGMGKWGALGKMIDPGRAGADTPEAQAFTGWAAGQGVADHMAALIYETLNLPKGAFEVVKGRMKLQNGEWGYMQDVVSREMKNPGSQPISDAERAAIKHIWEPLHREGERWRKDNGVELLDDNGKVIKPDPFYFPRQAIGKEGVEETTSFGSKGERIFATEEEGATGKRTDPDGNPYMSQTRIIYDPDFRSRVAKYVHSMYRSYYDAQLAKDPALKGETPKERYDALVEANRDQLAALSPNGRKERLKELRDSAAHIDLLEEGRIDRAGFEGKIYPMAVVKKAKSMFGEVPYAWMKHAQKAAATMQSMTLAWDFAVGQIQGAPLIFSKPQAWWSAQKAMIEALKSPEGMGAWLSVGDRAHAAKEMIQAGGNLFRLYDFLEGTEKGSHLDWLKEHGKNFGLVGQAAGLVGRSYTAMGRAVGAFLDAAKIESYMAEKATNKTDKTIFGLIESLENQIGSGRMRTTGMTPGRLFLERTLLALAPSYYRSAGNHIAEMFHGGVQSDVAIKSLARFATGMVLTHVAGMIAAGLSKEEIFDRLKPGSGKFLKVPINLFGSKMEVGAGNIYTSIARLIGNAYEFFFKPSPINTGVQGNPFLRFYRSHAPAGPRLFTDLVTGEDFFGEPQSPLVSVAKSFEPIMLQQTLHGKGDANQKAQDVLYSFLGAQAYPGGDSFIAHLDENAKKTFGMRYQNLSLSQQERIVKATEKVKVEFTPNMAYRAEAFRQARQKLLMNDLSKDSREKLGLASREVPAYSRSVQRGGVTIPLSDPQVQQYHKFLVEEYDREIGKWSPSIFNRKSADREKFINNSLDAARKRARERLR